MSEELKQAAQQALEALEHAEKDAADFQRLNTDQTSVAIKSLRQALTQRPAAQAMPEPLPLGPLAKRNIYDAIRGAYDLGYNDARNARTVPGDSAPGYDGRSVEEDHGSALFNILSKRLKPATPEPVQLDVVRQAIEERDAMESRYHELAKSMTYKGNSVAWWHSKATAYRNAIDEVWGALKAAGIYADGAKTCADGVRELAATPEPVGEVRCEGCGYMTHHREHMGCVRAAKQHTRPAPGVPDVEAAAKKLAECMGYPWEHMPSAGRDNMRKHAEAVLAAAQAKGGE